MLWEIGEDGIWFKLAGSFTLMVKLNSCLHGDAIYSYKVELHVGKRIVSSEWSKPLEFEFAKRDAEHLAQQMAVEVLNSIEITSSRLLTMGR